MADRTRVHVIFDDWLLGRIDARVSQERQESPYVKVDRSTFIRQAVLAQLIKDTSLQDG